MVSFNAEKQTCQVRLSDTGVCNPKFISNIEEHKKSEHVGGSGVSLNPGQTEKPSRSVNFRAVVNKVYVSIVKKDARLTFLDPEDYKNLSKR